MPMLVAKKLPVRAGVATALRGHRLRRWGEDLGHSDPSTEKVLPSGKLT